MGNVRVIAANTFREVLHQRALYSVAFMAILGVVTLLLPFGSLHMASDAGETKAVERISAELISHLLSFWDLVAMIMAASLGSAAVTKETETKTIVTVLSRPVGRGEFLLGKCLGIQAFTTVLVGLGIVAGSVLAWYLAVPLPVLFWFGAAQMLVHSLFIGTVSVGLGAFLPRGVAGIGAIFLPSIAMFAKPFFHAPFGAIATALYYAAPAAMPIDLVDASLGKELLDPQYGLYAAVLSENVLYAGAVLLLSTLLFSRREIRLG